MNSRHRSLDMLRGTAVLLVIGNHFYLSEGAPFLLKLWRRGGWCGVDIFFVLSGFLVSGLLFSEWRNKALFKLGGFYVAGVLKSTQLFTRSSFLL